MVFPKGYAEFAARWRVAFGFVVAALFLYLSRPTYVSLIAGLAIGCAGMALRAWAAGHLAKFESLAISGPYAYTRNPLYLGTLLVGIGFAAAGAQVVIGMVLVAFFVLFYLPVIEEEESYLVEKYLGYREYRDRVPRLWPALRPRYPSAGPFQAGLYTRNREYQALIGFTLGMAILLAKSVYLA